eukprot:scaffold238390_cov33-Tisochrysis_lutea.AAC.1
MEMIKKFFCFCEDCLEFEEGTSTPKHVKGIRVNIGLAATTHCGDRGILLRQHSQLQQGPATVTKKGIWSPCLFGSRDDPHPRLLNARHAIVCFRLQSSVLGQSDAQPLAPARRERASKPT